MSAPRDISEYKDNPHGPGKPRKYKAAEVIDALIAAKGIVTKAAERLGCTDITVHNYIKRFDSVREARDRAREQTIDLAESKLFLAIENGDQRAIEFYLRTVGKSRGYTERVEHAGPDGEQLKLEIEVIDARDKVENRLSE